MTDSTLERIENARKRLDIAEKWELPTMDPNFFAIVELADEVKKLSDMNASLGMMINDKVAEIKKLEAKLSALKEKYRWRKQSEEPAPRGELVLIRYTDYDDEDYYNIVKMENMYDPEGEIAYPLMYWRPLDLPEERNAG